MKKDLAVRDEMKSVVGYGDGNEAWGAGKNADKKDIVLPKILLMQGLSALVGKGLAKVGDMIESLEEQIIGSPTEPVEMIIFDTFKTFETYNNKKWVSTEMFKPEMAALPWNELVNDVDVERKTVINYYGMLVADIKAGVPFPVVITFRGMSYKAGKKLTTLFTRLEAFEKPSASIVLSIGAEQEENDKGKFHVFTVAKSRNSTKEEVAACFEWYKLLEKKKDSIKVQEEKSSTMNTTAQAPEQGATVMDGKSDVAF